VEAEIGGVLEFIRHIYLGLFACCACLDGRPSTVASACRACLDGRPSTVASACPVRAQCCLDWPLTCTDIRRQVQLYIPRCPVYAPRPLLGLPRPVDSVCLSLSLCLMTTWAPSTSGLSMCVCMCVGYKLWYVCTGYRLSTRVRGPVLRMCVGYKLWYVCTGYRLSMCVQDIGSRLDGGSVCALSICVCVCVGCETRGL
jgi:hypothetical protein